MIYQNSITELLAKILRHITERYVKPELAIPKSVLALKDEACGIAEKAAHEQNSGVLEEYELRLGEIYGELCK